MNLERQIIITCKKIWPGFCAGNFSLLRLQMGRVSILFLKGYLTGFFSVVISSEFLPRSHKNGPDPLLCHGTLLGVTRIAAEARRVRWIMAVNIFAGLERFGCWLCHNLLHLLEQMV